MSFLPPGLPLGWWVLHPFPHSVVSYSTSESGEGGERSAEGNVISSLKSNHSLPRFPWPPPPGACFRHSSLPRKRFLQPRVNRFPLQLVATCLGKLSGQIKQQTQYTRFPSPGVRSSVSSVCFGHNTNTATARRSPLSCSLECGTCL